MLLALITIGGVSLVVYGHHLFTQGLSGEARTYFAWATYLVAIPTGAKYYTWLVSLHRAQIDENLGLHAAVGFLWYFAIGGFTGVVLADASLDIPLHDAYYVVAHFHLVMAVAIVYALMGVGPQFR